MWEPQPFGTIMASHRPVQGFLYLYLYIGVLKIKITQFFPSGVYKIVVNLLGNILFRVLGSSFNRNIITDAVMECCFKISYWWGVAIVREFPRILKEMFVELIKKNQLSLSVLR
jgi:hypothetical protein